MTARGVADARAPVRAGAPVLVLPGLAVLAVLAGCDWVDSTGVQPGDVPGGAAEITIDDIALGDAVALSEGTRVRVRVSAALATDDDGTPLTLRWEPDPLAEGALDTCAAFDGVDPERMPPTLGEACTDGDDCRFAFDADPAAADGGGEALFTLAVPRLRAPVGRRHALVGSAVVPTDPAAGDANADPVTVERFRREVDFCLIAINEAPDARADGYVVVDGDALDVGAESGVLANDEDDVDTGNAPLTATLVSGPERAAFFELRADGGFTYEPLPAEGGADVEDGFEYEVSDGIPRESNPRAPVSLRTVVGNRAPIAVEGAPAVTVTVGEAVDIDLAGRFADPEGADLSFSFAEGLPDDGSLELLGDGVLVGVAGPGDIGEYALTLVADDGESAVGTTLPLVVEGDLSAVGPPVFASGASVFDQTIRLGGNIAALTPEFDGGAPPLSFASAGEPMPVGVVVDAATGRVAGRPRVPGGFPDLAVSATDANGAVAVSDTFSIRVRR